jgi:hypothetical protein
MGEYRTMPESTSSSQHSQDSTERAAEGLEQSADSTEVKAKEGQHGVNNTQLTTRG